MPGMGDIFNSITKVADTLNKVTGKIDKATKSVSDVTRDISSIGNSYSRRKQFKESGELERIKQEIEVYNRKGMILLRCCVGLWGILLIATIILCVAGNDVVLRILHI